MIVSFRVEKEVVKILRDIASRFNISYSDLVRICISYYIGDSLSYSGGNSSRYIVSSIRVRREFLDMIENTAKRAGLSRSKLIRVILHKCIEKGAMLDLQAEQPFPASQLR
jgi:antitoxin component of RelBE/YafQ-DinJ toxin-antitoxin module